MLCKLGKNKLTSAQKREYNRLLEYESLYVYGAQRRKVFYELVKKDLAEITDSWYWFHLKKV